MTVQMHVLILMINFTHNSNALY